MRNITWEEAIREDSCWVLAEFTESVGSTILMSIPLEGNILPSHSLSFSKEMVGRITIRPVTENDKRQAIVDEMKTLREEVAERENKIFRLGRKLV